MSFSQYTQNSEYNKHIKQWDITYDCLTDNVKPSGVKYLPCPAMPDSLVAGNSAKKQANDYIKYMHEQYTLRMAVFFNFTQSTLAAWIGTIMQKTPVLKLSDAGESKIDYLSFNADGRGNGLDQMAKKGLESTFAYGGGLYLVTVPNSPMSEASIRDGSLAPRIQLFDRRHILDWRYDFVNSQRQLTYIKIIDGRLVQDGIDFRDEILCVSYQLINGLCYYSVKKQDVTDGDVIEVDNEPLVINGVHLDRIPAFACGAMDNDLEVDCAPLTVIANKNIEHYQLSSSHQQQCVAAGRGQPHLDIGDIDKIKGAFSGGKGFNPVEALNPQGLIFNSTFPVITCKGKFELIQLSTDSLLAQEPERIEKQAQKLGAIMMTEQSNETATAARIAASGMNAQLVTISDNVSRALTSAIEFIAEIVGYQYDDIRYELSKDLIETAYTFQDKQADLQLVEAGRLPVRSYFEKLKRMGEIDEDMTYDEYKAEVEEDAAQRDLGALPEFGNNQEQQIEE